VRLRVSIMIGNERGPASNGSIHEVVAQARALDPYCALLGDKVMCSVICPTGTWNLMTGPTSV
jgi:hypothetical protein